MKLLLIVLSVLGLLLTASACSCIMPKPPLDAMEDADAVFRGKVVQIDSAMINGLPNKVATFDLYESWKGPQRAKLRVETASNSAACGINFIEGEEYVVYAYGLAENLTSSLCDRTAQTEYAQDDLDALGQGNIISKEVEKRTEPITQDYLIFYLPIIILAAFIIFIVLKFKK